MTLPTVIVAAVAVMALGCVRGPAATAAMVENTTVTPASVKARISAGEVTVLWRDISVYLHYTTFRYLCRLAGAGPAPFR